MTDFVTNGKAPLSTLSVRLHRRFGCPVCWWYWLISTIRRLTPHQ